MKKFLCALLVLTTVLGFGACKSTSSGGDVTSQSSLEEIMTYIVDGVELPNSATTFTPANEQFSSYAFVEYKEGYQILVNEASINAIAHSVVLLRASDENEAKSLEKKVEENVNPRKWICVEAEKTEVSRKGNIILIVMSSTDVTEKIDDRFEKIGK